MLDFDINIEKIENGYLVSYQNPQADEYDYIKVYCENIAHALQEVLEYYEPGSRHDEKRTYVIQAPGDKHPNFTDAHSDVIWPDLADSVADDD